MVSLLSWPRSRVPAVACLLMLAAVRPLPAQDAPAAIPDAWLGEWHGEMTNYGSRGASSQIPVSLRIAELSDGSYEWRTVYNQDLENGVRDYRLVPTPGTSTRFVMDEQNGILLEASLLGGALVTPFSVAGQTLVSRYTLRADGTLIHEIIYWPDEPGVVSRGSGVGGEAGAEVRSFEAAGIQRTVFDRMP